MTTTFRIGVTRDFLKIVSAETLKGADKLAEETHHLHYRAIG